MENRACTNFTLLPAAEGTPVYERSELRSSGKRIGAALRMAWAERFVCSNDIDEIA